MRHRLPSFFLMKKTGNAIGDLEGADATCLKVFKDELIEFLLFIRCQGVDLTIHRFSIRDEFDCMVPRLAIQQGIKGRLCKHVLKIMKVSWNRITKCLWLGILVECLCQLLAKWVMMHK